MNDRDDLEDDDEHSYYASHQDGTARTEIGTVEVMDDEYACDISCSPILRGLGEVWMACVRALQDYL